MNLASTELIDSLIASARPRRRLPARTRCPTPVEADERFIAANSATTRRCHCGACAKCAEAARWEEIFQKKFADPEYYSRRALRHASPLNELVVKCV